MTSVRMYNELINEYANFKKELPVQIIYDDEVATISAKVTAVRYLITVRPDTELEEIDKLLLEKGYIEKSN